MILLAPFRKPLRIPTRSRTRRQRARVAVRSTVLAFILATVGYSGLAETIAPTLRDPEYGKKLTRVKATLAANPSRPLVVFIGSSRVGMGVQPSALNQALGPTGPVTHNHSLIGSGPLFQLMTYQRLRRDGIKPQLIVLEYWPLMLKQTGIDFEQGRLDPVRLFYADREMIDKHFHQPEKTYQAMKQARLNPFTTSRSRILGLTLSNWLPLQLRVDGGWSELDSGGWFPGPPEIYDDHALSLIEVKWKGILNNFSIGEFTDTCYRELIELCQRDGVEVAILWMPESKRFRGLYPPAVDEQCQSYLRKLSQDTHMPVLNLRNSMADIRTPDGFHLSQRGAKEFALILAREIQAKFPHLYSGAKP